MTPIFLNDTFYLVDNISLNEILSIANNEGLNSPKIRAKAIMQLNVDFYNSSMIKGFVSNIDSAIYQLGDKYLVKRGPSIKDLDYFIGPDNKKYTCELDYTKNGKQPVQPVVVSETLEEHDNFRDAGLSLEADEEKKEKIDVAIFLDGLLSKHNKVSTFINGVQLQDVERYLNVSREDLEREVKKTFLAEARMTDIDGDLSHGVIENAIGSSNNMFDALLTFPVFSAIIGKKNLSEKFSMIALDGAEFVRICPVGVDEKGNLFGFVHMVRLNSPVITRIENEIKSDLKKEGRKFSSLSSQEKYTMFEERIADYFSKNNGRMLMASGSRKYVNIVEFINNMAKKYTVPNVYNEEDGMMLWPSHEIITFDNRGSKTLKEQVEEIYAKKESVVTRTVAPKPRFINPPVIEAERREKETVIIPFCPPQHTEEETTQGLTLFETIVRLSGKNTAESLTLHNQSGDVVGEIPIKKTAANPKKTGVRPGILGEHISSTNVTVGGIDPIKPTKYIDEDGREWVSKEARNLVMSTIFGPGIAVGNEHMIPRKK